jgi:hypothetical protein
LWLFSHDPESLILDAQDDTKGLENIMRGREGHQVNAGFATKIFPGIDRSLDVLTPTLRNRRSTNSAGMDRTTALNIAIIRTNGPLFFSKGNLMGPFCLQTMAIFNPVLLFALGTIPVMNDLGDTLIFVTVYDIHINTFKITCPEI